MDCAVAGKGGARGDVRRKARGRAWTEGSTGDYDFMLRVMTDPEMNLHYLPEMITRMRLGGASTGSLKGIIQKMREDIRASATTGSNIRLPSSPPKTSANYPSYYADSTSLRVTQFP